ncbi:metal ABC transporter permease [Thalassoroseus pseudoceratinae]|uniref:metal ABC transporter permease n=1 Tax=Thalassoroseus pseudoceratinae TaxID=2713176 RepID=UPI00198157D0|nr:iron chelate uptake ABC transporter family permease subunit [Thalassoroseus pseudoceratinae]
MSPEMSEEVTHAVWQPLVLLEDYNTRVVLLGVTLLCCAAGVVGSLTLLRKRALMGDALSHSTWPGITLAFIIAKNFGQDEKSLATLLLGATLSGLLGLCFILVIRNATRLKEDAALGAVLSIFFGIGVALFGVIQQMKGNAAGLESFIYGKTASMGIQDIKTIAVAATICLIVCGLLFKEFKLLCFDEGFTDSQGFPSKWLDLTLMGLVTVICIVGLQAVGLVLVIAILIIPAAAARFWTKTLSRMTLISSIIGACSGFVGAAVSAVFYRLPSGAMIVLVCSTMFAISLLFGTERGMLVRWLRRRHFNLTIDRQHFLRGMFELAEEGFGENPTSGLPQCPPIPFCQLLAKRSWSAKRLHQAIARAKNDRIVVETNDGLHLTPRGMSEAIRLTRQHRLWELYLMTHADVAASRVDQEADAIEHVLEPEVIIELEALLEKNYPQVPTSPH